MKDIRIKYCIAVAVAVIATAFCGCGDDGEEVITFEDDSRTSVIKENDHKEEESGKEDTPDGEIRVYVCGAVRHPDVYTVSSGSRVKDAVDAAGGLGDDAAGEYVNLAAVLTDGVRVYIPCLDDVKEVDITQIDEEKSQKNTSISGNTSNGKVDINHADQTTLMTLPGIGQSKADKIIAYRESNGAFSSIEDIMLVGGIKEGLFDKVKDRICVR